MRLQSLLYTKHHLKFGKNQADNLVAVENRFILDFGADFLSIVLLVFSISMVRILVIIAFTRLDFRNPIIQGKSSTGFLLMMCHLH